MYYYTEGVGRDFKKSFDLFQRASEENNLEGTTMLWIMYYVGHGVTKDVESALVLFQQAANGGDAGAARKLGEIYYLGSQNKRQSLRRLLL